MLCLKKSLWMSCAIHCVALHCDTPRYIFKHPAFVQRTKLEQLCIKYGIEIVWCPKFHCELNSIEELWCFSKNFVRKHTDQDYNKLLPLIKDSFVKYQESGLHAKLMVRFWECIDMYNRGEDYKSVLQTLFGAKSSNNTLTHKKVKKNNT